MGRRTRIAEGVYSDRYGLSACVKLGKVQREKRFPADTPLEILKSWRVQTRADLDTETPQQPRAPRGTLEHDVSQFLKRKIGRVGYKSVRSHLRAWFPRFASVPRWSMTRANIEQQIADWLAADVAIRTVRSRCFLLRECWRALDGRRARTPLDDVRLPKPPLPQPTAVPLKTIQTVAKNLKAAKLDRDYARFLIRATTGQRPAQIMKATPNDLDFKRRIWFVRPSKGGTLIPLPLNEEMVKAWKTFVKVNAWGTFDTTQAAATLRAHGWPEKVRPYALRATFAIDLLLRGADLGDVQGLLGHTETQTTRKYYAPILTAKLARTVSLRKLSI